MKPWLGSLRRIRTKPRYSQGFSSDAAQAMAGLLHWLTASDCAEFYFSVPFISQNIDVFMAKVQEKLDSVQKKGLSVATTKVTTARLHASPPEPLRLEQENSPVSETLNSSRDSAKLTGPVSLARVMKSRQCKRKMLESIPEPPPLSPLACAVSAGARKEFKRPRQVTNGVPVREEH